MKPQNSSERSSAFSNFLIFFTVTVAVIVISVFFSFEVPLKENDQLRAKVFATETQKAATRVFLDKMETTVKLLDTINRAGVNAVLVESDIEETLKSMKASAKTIDSTGSLFLDIVFLLSKLEEAKRDLRQVSGQSEKLIELTNENNKLQDLIKEKDGRLNEYERILNAYSRPQGR